MTTTAIDTWTQIRAIIVDAQAKKSPAKANALYPFALPPDQNERFFWSTYQRADPIAKGSAVCAEIAQFPPQLGAAMFAPRQLCSALVVCGVPHAKATDTAEQIMMALHKAAYSVICLRRKHLNIILHQKELYRHFVLGIPQQYVTDLLARQNVQGPGPPNPVEGVASTIAPGSPSSLCGGVEPLPELEDGQWDDADIEYELDLEDIDL